MLKTRVIPTLLLRDNGLVKGENFKNHKYIGDPINAVKIFNEKEVDEIVFLDISATPNRREPNFELLSDIASEAFMPFGYGGGISSLNQIEKLFNLGVEKVIMNTSAFLNRKLVRDASKLAGAQSVVVSIDVRKTFLGGYEVYSANGSTRTKFSPVDYAKQMEELGAGELILCSIANEGTGRGYDMKLLESVCSAVDIPVVALGGCGGLEDMKEAVTVGFASAVAAGNFFVFHGKHKAVLITYPKYSELLDIFGSKGRNG
jgi:imidazole glycerol-phosphate synthase subunit HisF